MILGNIFVFILFILFLIYFRYNNLNVYFHITFTNIDAIIRVNKLVAKNYCSPYIFIEINTYFYIRYFLLLT